MDYRYEDRKGKILLQKTPVITSKKKKKKKERKKKTVQVRDAFEDTAFQARV
jgi:hypothetical protein